MKNRRTKHQIADWLEIFLSKELRISVEEVRQRQRFDSLGVDSLMAAQIAAELEAMIGRPFMSEEIYEHEDIQTLAANLSS